MSGRDDGMSRAHRFGWLLFLVSSVCFAVAGLLTRDWWVVAGSAIFGVACVVFLVADP